MVADDHRRLRKVNILLVHHLFAHVHHYVKEKATIPHHQIVINQFLPFGKEWHKKQQPDAHKQEAPTNKNDKSNDRQQKRNQGKRNLTPIFAPLDKKVVKAFFEKKSEKQHGRNAYHGQQGYRLKCRMLGK